MHNKNQWDALSFQIYSNKYPLHVSNRLTIQGGTSIVLAASKRGCMINATDHMYSKLPTEDE